MATTLPTSDDDLMLLDCCTRDDVHSFNRLVIRHPSDMRSLVLRVIPEVTSFYHVCARAGAVNVLKLLLDINKNRLPKDEFGFSPLLRAAEAGKLECVRALWSDSSARDVDNTKASALHRAAGAGSVDVVGFLLDQGMFVDLKDNTGRTPLFYACRFGKGPAARVLLRNKADPDTVDVTGISILAKTIEVVTDDIDQAADCLMALLEYDVDPNRKVGNELPLRLAIAYECPLAVEILLKAGADPYLSNGPDQPCPLDALILRTDERMLQACARGIGEQAVVKRRCEICVKLDPYEFVKKHIFVVGLGKVFCVDAQRSFWIFGPLLHVCRLADSGQERALLLQNGDNQGLPFYVLSDEVVENPLNGQPSTPLIVPH